MLLLAYVKGSVRLVVTVAIMELKVADRFEALLEKALLWL